MNQQPSSLKKSLLAIVVFIALGLLAALPAGLVALLGGIQAGLDIYLLAAITVASWMPLKLLLDRVVKGTASMNYPVPRRFDLNTLVLLLFGSMVLIPVLYVMTLIAFLVGLMTYIFTENLLIALAAALLMQTYTQYRSAQREKEQGVSNDIFVRFQNLNMSMNYDISIDAQSSRAAQEPYYDDVPDLILLPSESSERLQQAHNPEETIIVIDPEETDSEQDES